MPTFCRQKCTNAANQFCQADSKVTRNHFPPCHVALLWSMRILSPAYTLERGTGQGRRAGGCLAIQRMRTQMYIYVGSLELSKNNYKSISDQAFSVYILPFFITWKTVRLGRKKHF